MVKIMKTLKESIIKTHAYLDGHFQTCENGNLIIDTEYFLDSLRICIDNTSWIIRKISDNRRSPIHSCVWSGILELCDMELKHDGYKASNYHIKKWFEKYNINYEELLKPLIKEYSEYREECISEQEGN